jgi:hypothetical protein
MPRPRRQGRPRCERKQGSFSQGSNGTWHGQPRKRTQEKIRHYGWRHQVGEPERPGPGRQILGPARLGDRYLTVHVTTTDPSK